MKVSIIVTTHNRLGFLEEALRSVSLQLFKDYEVIVVNDHIETSNEVEMLIGKFRNTILLNNFETPGANFSRNKGIRSAKGKYIAFLDDDDIWEPEYLIKQVSNIETKNIDLSYSGFYEFWDSCNQELIPIYSSSPPENVSEEMASGKFCPETTSAVVVRKSALIDSGLFDTELDSFQDWDLWYRISKKHVFGNVPTPLIKFRQHLGVRTSVDYTKRINGLNKVIDKWGDELKNDFYEKFILGCYYSNAKKFAMFKEYRSCLQVILSNKVFFTTVKGVRMSIEIIFKLLFR